MIIFPQPLYEHVYPTNDIARHVCGTIVCWCGPEVVEVEETLVIKHNNIGALLTPYLYAYIQLYDATDPRRKPTALPDLFADDGDDDTPDSYPTRCLDCGEYH